MCEILTSSLPSRLARLSIGKPANYKSLIEWNLNLNASRWMVQNSREEHGDIWKWGETTIMFNEHCSSSMDRR
jgi:hypothetical protein